jgi:glutathione S-transferase
MRFGVIEERPAFVEYWQRVSDRDAYRRASEIDDGLIAAAEKDAAAEAADT